ncbi:heat shock factor protein-like isoform X2 [Ostrea edulis]|uniref:heat shock factor protein-like isoform X2 n=1 Tax=Ostrea edulis TaxID=37623 RepID=UPI0024AF45CC|nr:heat shock factor protein-like isoform X2 [Ostrea edulis]
MYHATIMGSNPVPAFLTKLWALVENPTCDDLICWDESGKSFHVFDQGRFAKEILPLYFKHSNIASFIRQLNMYGFRKVANIEQGLRLEKDDLEFHHPYFQRGEEQLLEHIKRKITHHLPVHPKIKMEPVQEVSVPAEDLDRMVSEVSQVKGKQEMMNSKLETMKRENEVLWREVASLRQKHIKQTQIVNKLIQFLVHLVGANRVTSANKRKMPLMISDTASPKVPRYNNLPIDMDTAGYTVHSPESYSSVTSSSNGPIIHDITDQHTGNPKQTSDVKIEQPAIADISDLALPLDLMTSPSGPDASEDREDLNLFSGDLLSDSGNFPKVMSMSDLGRLGYKTSVSDSKSSPSTSVTSTGQVKDFHRQKSVSEMSDHVDSVNSDIEGLKDLLSGSNYFDPSMLLGLFNPDGEHIPTGNSLFNADGSINAALGDSILAGLDSIKSDDLSNSGSLVQYKMGDESVPDLFDLAEMSKEDNEEDSTKDCMDQSNKSKSLDTPLPIQISADDLD